MDLSSFWYGIYKLSKYAVYPYTWAVLLLGLLTILVLRRASPLRFFWIRFLTVSALLLVCMLGSPFVARFLATSLEEQYPSFNDTMGARFDTIVVLGGGIYPKGTLRPADTLSHFSAERTMCGVDLFHRRYADRLLLSGGDASVFGEGPQEAPAMKQLAMRLGVPDGSILIETRSRTTYESALEIEHILGNKPVLLVTSASHMPRALALLRKRGMNSTPVPCGYFATDRRNATDITPFDFLPQVHALEISTHAISEMVGTVVYRALGKL